MLAHHPWQSVLPHRKLEALRLWDVNSGELLLVVTQASKEPWNATDFDRSFHCF